MHLASKLDQLEKRFDELTQQMADPAIISDSDQYRKVTKARSELSDIVAKYREWKKVEDSLSQARPMLQDPDPELKSMAEMEITELEPQKAQIEEDLKVLLLPRSEEHTSELQSLRHLVCRLLLEKKKKELIAHHKIGSSISSQRRDYGQRTS